MARTKDYTAQNQKLFEAGLKKYAEKTIKPMLSEILARVARNIVAYVGKSFQPFGYYGGGNEMFPIWTSNLRDATGVAVYIDGVMTSYQPTELGIEQQVHKGDFSIIGAERFEEAVNLALTDYSTGIWIVLFSAVPYAYDVTNFGSPWGRGIGFFENLEDALTKDIISNIKEFNAS